MNIPEYSLIYDKRKGSMSHIVMSNEYLLRDWGIRDLVKDLRYSALQKQLHSFSQGAEYLLIMLNVLEYACISLKKQSSGYDRILNESDAVHSIKSLYKLLSSYRDRDVMRTLPNIYDWGFCQKK